MTQNVGLLTVIIPVFNEAATIRAATERLLATGLPVPVEVLVVDDGSTDGSMDCIHDLAEAGKVRILEHSTNRGKGAAVRTGIEAASGDFLTILDADLEVDPANYRDLLEPLMRGDARVVYGTRFFGPHNAYSYWYVLGHKLLAHWASLLFNTWLTDVYTCFKLGQTALWRDLRLCRDDFGIEAEITAKFLRKGERIHEVPIDYWPRGRDEGKKISAWDGVKAFLILARIRFAPLSIVRDR